MASSIAIIAVMAMTGIASLGPAEATTDEAVITRQLRTIIDALDAKDRQSLRAATWPGATLSVTGVGATPISSQPRPWEDIPFSQLHDQSTMSNPVIRIRGNHAKVEFETTSRIFQGTEFAGIIYRLHEQAGLERRKGEWRVRDWARRIVSVSNKARR